MNVLELRVCVEAAHRIAAEQRELFRRRQLVPEHFQTNRRDVAAIRLEMLWNKLAASKKFSLLCGYAMGSFYTDAQLKDIHRQHSHVFSGDGLDDETHSATVQ